MNAYRTSAKIKLGLIVAAVLIAVASLAYTNALANRLMQQEREAIRVWTRAIEYQARIPEESPYAEEFEALAAMVDAAGLSPSRADSLRLALTWARGAPESDEIDFVFSEIVRPARFSVPAVITDEAMTSVVTFQNVRVDTTLALEEMEVILLQRASEMDARNEPLRLDLGEGLVQLVHFGESRHVRELRVFPFVQLGFVALFVMVGYLGFSYIRRSEQSSLWVGMAKEAAHQLGTPLSSLSGWIELLRMREEGMMTVPVSEVADELEHDVVRLGRVAERFSKIGSVPELSPNRIAPLLEHTADYFRRRLPQQSRRIKLSVEADPDLAALVNVELFDWVIENLLKNALDAIDDSQGTIVVRAEARDNQAVVEVEDTGRGIERRVQKLIFRPGFSTKKRGWGLGLSLANRIVKDYHGGKFELAESRVGKGTTFRISLRRVEMHQGEAVEKTRDSDRNEK
ncbi:ATP-binding protein [soil metagenome]